MQVIGLTVDVPVSDLDRAIEFYARVFDRGPDLRPRAGMAEWVLTRDPELAVRLVAGDPVPDGGVRVGIGVAAVAAEQARLRADAAVRTTPGVIAVLELRDPDGNRVVLWQDLLAAR